MKEIPGKTITPESLVEMFQNIEENTEWNISDDLLWGYFFTHSEPKKLEAAASVLAKQGYALVSVYLSEKEHTDDPDMYWLHIEKPETHTPKSLDERNDAFYIFANEFGVDSYDGMDVGPIK